MNTDALPDASYPERILAPVMNFHLAMDVALGVNDDTILEAYNLQYHELQAVKKSGIFLEQLKQVTDQLKKSGGAFKLKAQAQAEALLAETFKMAIDRDMDPKVRADMIKSNVRWAGWDAPQQAAAGGGGGFTVNINLGQAHDVETQVYDQEGLPA